MARRAGDRRSVKARNARRVYSAARMCHGRSASSSGLIALAKNCQASGVSRVKSALEVVGAQIARVGLEELPHARDGHRWRRPPASSPAASVQPFSRYQPSPWLDLTHRTHSAQRTSDDPQLPADLAERVERELQLVARVRRGDDRPHARLVARDGRERDALREDAFLEQPIRELSSPARRRRRSPA